MTYGGAPNSLISMPEIAELAGVRRPVVTTWRRRHPDFPAPISREQGRPLFGAIEVVDWLAATGRGERSRLVPDLRLHQLAGLTGGRSPSAGRRHGAGGRREQAPLVTTLTALVCLSELTGEPLSVPGEPGWRAVGLLRDRAAKVDPDDRLLRAEIDAMGSDDARLIGVVDELVEAAWGAGPAYERIIAAAGRLGAGDLAADALAPAAASLVAGLSGAREHADRYGEVRVADPAAATGDLLVAVLDQLGEDATATVLAAEADPLPARLLRRRLLLRGLTGADRAVTIGDPAVDPGSGRAAGGAGRGAGGADVLVTRLPYLPKERRGEHDPFTAVRRLADALLPGRTAVVLGPADLLVGALPSYRPALRSRAELLRDGLVEAVIQLPGGLMPYRPAYQTAIWVLRREEPAAWQGRVLLADVSDRPLTARVVETLVWDVVTWRRDGHRPDQHVRGHAAQVSVADLLGPRVPLTTRPPARLRDLSAPRAAVARVVELEAELGAVTAADTGAGSTPVRSRLAAREEPAPVHHRTVAELLRAGLLMLRSGTRVAPGDVATGGHHRLLGAPELTGQRPVGVRTVDRKVFADRYPHARLTEPGDLVVTLTPRLGVWLDTEGYSVVEFPARVLRVPPQPTGGRRPAAARPVTRVITTRVLAALLASLPEFGHSAGRAPGAVRSPARLVDLRLPVPPPAEVERLDALLAAADARRVRAQREISMMDELCRIATTGLGHGTLTLAGDPAARPDR